MIRVMKHILIYLGCGLFVAIFVYGCSPKYGCPANGKSVGAERILSDEKAPKAKAFKH